MVRSQLEAGHLGCRVLHVHACGLRALLVDLSAWRTFMHTRAHAIQQTAFSKAALRVHQALQGHQRQRAEGQASLGSLLASADGAAAAASARLHTGPRTA
eukprot:5228829-Lingulodinium_polyedra.AAC.1